MILAFSGFSVLLALFYWLLLALLMIFSEDVIFNRQLSQELQRQLDYHARYQQFDQLPSGMQIYPRSAIDMLPYREDLLEMDEAIAGEVEDFNLHVIRATLPGEQESFFIIFAVADQEIDDASFNRFNQLSLVALLVVAITGILMGGWIGSRTASPILRLERRVRSLKESDCFGETASFGPDEVGRLARAFADAYDRSQQFLEREQRFTREVSHELRTPSAVIRGALDILALKPDSPNALARIQRASQQLEQLIDTFLLLGREKNLRLSSDVLDADALCRTLVEQHQVDARVPIHFYLQQDPQLRVLPPVFAVLLGNLLNNAVQHTSEGEITLSLNAEQLTVSDTGHGFPPEMLPQVGQPYIEGCHGQGLGLSIVARICQQFGWTLQISSKPGKGSQVEIRFNSG